ncbi:hypothetical protein NIES4072_66330 [Nostoc commune NIES-4072]|uniref:Uncharacterized protein n=1 Tax=Nostoc commune NIES-4072 TaxID=2005467 RepID=A0A2R5G4E7_NOSCO|nr:hypothetical protein [Nostoc commune]BBD70267.1 hypothetical protein NIES4070_66780 [Nostoc commune HK-02]GBG22921.1 hypothetical protein NIES4072_66330 [Nostoc commune NIES-4072]
MSRIKRWINMHKKEFNADGSLKNEARQEMLSVGMSNEAIDDYASRLKARYDEWKHLDETDPEPWPIYTAYDFFTEQEKREFSPDGSLKPEYLEYAQKMGFSEGALEQLEWRKKMEVDHYNKVSAKHAEQGINFGEERMKERIEDSKTYVQRRQQMEQDLRNFEDVDSLPFDKDTAY